jgi:hypothetical protein
MHQFEIVQSKQNVVADYHIIKRQQLLDDVLIHAE